MIDDNSQQKFEQDQQQEWEELRFKQEFEEFVKSHEEENENRQMA